LVFAQLVATLFKLSQVQPSYESCFHYSFGIDLNKLISKRGYRMSSLQANYAVLQHLKIRKAQNRKCQRTNASKTIG